MTLMAQFLNALEQSRIATTIAQSVFLTGFFSGVHLLGLTLLVGGAIVIGLRMIGVLLPDQPLSEVGIPTTRGMTTGLAVSVITGVLLFSARATSVAANQTFQIKMGLLVAAVLFHFAIQRRVV